MKRKIKDADAYSKVVEAFKSRKDGATPVDVVSITGLPIEKVKEFAPAAADEFGARLRVTESGEILYSFPDGFKSRYTGFGPTMKRVFSVFKKGAIAAAVALFKVWIMLMLVGYFVLFMAIALVALVASFAVSASGSSNDRSDRRGGGMGGMLLVSRLFDMMLRIWFYSELTKSYQDPYGRRSRAPRANGKPLHKAIFSFVFGDGDPNADWETRERQATLAYIQANRGVISLPEFMALTGKPPVEAEQAITAYLVEFGGSPEATDDGTVVYRFDELLRHSERASTAPASAPLKRLKAFSSNPKKMNGWFMALNGVNLLFGGYFLVNALTVGQITQHAQVTGATYLYRVALVLFSGFSDPVFFAASVLGLVPLLFAVLFFLVPGLRGLREKAENEQVKTENLRKTAYRQVWENPAAVRSADFDPSGVDSRPNNLATARERMIEEIGSYAQPDVEIAADGSTRYSFPALAEEREALDKYRATIDPDKYRLGDTVFDSHN